MNKSTYIIGSILSIGLVACGQSNQETTNSKNQETTNSNPVSSIAKVVAASSKIEDVNVIMENLKKTPPFTTEQLKSVLPESFNSIKKSGYSINNVLGAGTIEATYKTDAVKYIIKIYDGAGEMGANMGGMILMDQAMNPEFENEDGYRKPTIVQNIKGSETQAGKKTATIENKITLRINNQVFIEVSADGTEMSELKKGIENSQLIEKIEQLKH